ncbi:hypothetical protein Pla175_13360 [Pirellulimonas nuda]|uniref:Carboxypeptidase regulatory-like domain-containing protein n=1 Tax=Pirellulimonas nuda TaxID=2528009 RepID=A0A518D914_9BACT|nr:hypothetical protein [Pirellulimonas nuda]QDU87969.1 hypothetical protein Pla175_13360 [Pirellulimonas nuda]
MRYSRRAACASTWRRPLAAACVLVAAASSVGCGSGLATVTGAVTLDGAPLAGGGDTRAMVYLYPEGGTGAPAVGLLNEAGEYQISTGTRDGVEPGAYLVTISASQLTGKDIPGAPRSAVRITPPKYADPRQSGLRVDVASGANKYDFALESDPTTRRRRAS